MSDGLDPSGPAQPNLNDAYTASGNNASKDPQEQAQGQSNKNANSNPDNVTDQRIPREQSSSVNDATPSSLGRGIHGAPPGEEAKGYTQEQKSRVSELDAEQMAAPGEGKVAAAVTGQVGGKTGTGGTEPGLESDLDRKKREQAPAREAVKEERSEKVDVEGVLGQSAAPADDSYAGKNN
jgi:hypothetical protein